MALHGGETLPRSLIQKGFIYDGVRVPLVGPPGIFKPSLLEFPISITTKPAVEGQPRPYEDAFSQDGRSLSYRYRGTDPMHPDNVRLRAAMTHQVPLIYFHGVVPGYYVPTWPAYVVGDDPDGLTFTVQLDQPHVLAGVTAGEATDAPLRRAYTTRLVLQRLHQADFRVRVVRAYRQMCAVCRLRHTELLDAAHILPDTHPRGEPVIPNGLALCKLHHAAFDQNIIGVRPDLVIEVNQKVLEEKDGPMLVHGLQGFHSIRLSTPRRPEHQPDPDFLDERYRLFKAAG